jgi:hypothetical protein
MGASYTGVDARYTTVVGLRRGDLLDDKPLEEHTVVLIDGSLDELESVARAVRREVDAIRAGLGDEATVSVGEPPTDEPGSRSAAGIPPTLDYIAIDPDGRLRLVSAILTPGGTLPILQSAVGGYIERVPNSDEDDIDCWANEDGLPLRLPRNVVGSLVHQRVIGFDQPLVLVGTIVFAGTDGENTISLTPGQRQRVLDAWTAARRDLP